MDKEYYKKIDLFVKENFQKNEVEILENIENKYLINLYKNSSFYIFTSYSEVFGFTTLEAISLNIPILVSDTSALKEINGNMAEYFDPDDVNDIKTKMIKFNLKVKNNESFISQRNHFLKKYSWQENILKTFKIIKSLN